MAVVAPSTMFPLAGYERLCFLKNVVDHPQITVGDYTYYDDFEDVNNFQKHVRYLFDFTGDRLIIGKFCMIASGVEFVMNGANHLAGAVSAYPFAVFGGDWAGAMAGKTYPTKGDTTVGNDVWLGYRATILPGVAIGDGAIVGAHAVVTRDVAPYNIVGGNPAQVIRPRFDAATTARLLAVAWWHWPIEKITRHAALLTGDAAHFLAEVERAR
ncbi:CatB-related O-acetyltransferase [Hymenobacter sp. PAMC 26628]|uniref:CatB-related O-acetyltransferase n=1 Tax=Hymenobacter sp. PAMC 26628 TaxID=1484118 RepID=UPI0007702E0E|nr:CatB-related O-acetyltransferase [Hymenobacter sp. PAMC 26628]AMJ64309.1 chloramphenicol acetyltransferase [Hymenobacter sp. PAMC 26628]